MLTTRSNCRLTIEGEKALDAWIEADLNYSHVAAIKPKALKRRGLNSHVADNEAFSLGKAGPNSSHAEVGGA